VCIFIYLLNLQRLKVFMCLQTTKWCFFNFYFANSWLFLNLWYLLSVMMMKSCRREYFWWQTRTGSFLTWMLAYYCWYYSACVHRVNIKADWHLAPKAWVSSISVQRVVELTSVNSTRFSVLIMSHVRFLLLLLVGSLCQFSLSFWLQPKLRTTWVSVGLVYGDSFV